LAEKTDETLLYAALELRQSVEAFVYEKLWVYRERLPSSLKRTWQPPQAFKVLAELEPGAETSTTVSFARQEQDGVAAPGPYKLLGRDLRPDIRWLTKTWNKLGSLLHAENPFAAQRRSDPAQMRAFLESVACDLEPFVTTRFTSAIANLVSFECSFCGHGVVANLAGVKARGIATCLNSECEARFEAVVEGEEVCFRPEASEVQCAKCGYTMSIPTDPIAIGYRFSCSSCRTEFEVTRRSWGFETVGGSETE
jgi:hypothetical protein